MDRNQERILRETYKKHKHIGFLSLIKYLHENETIVKQFDESILLSYLQKENESPVELFDNLQDDIDNIHQLQFADREIDGVSKFGGQYAKTKSSLPISYIISLRPHFNNYIKFLETKHDRK